MDHLGSVTGSSQTDRGVNCGVDEINEVQLGISKDQKELGASSIVFITPTCGLDLPHPSRKQHLHNISTPPMVTGILS
jgi:hypothetical protein